MTLAEKLQGLRAEAGLSQEELAEARVRRHEPLALWRHAAGRVLGGPP